MFLRKFVPPDRVANASHALSPLLQLALFQPVGFAGPTMQVGNAKRDIGYGPAAVWQRVGPGRVRPGFFLSRGGQKRRDDLRPSQPSLRKTVKGISRQGVDRMP